MLKTMTEQSARSRLNHTPAASIVAVGFLGCMPLAGADGNPGPIAAEPLTERVVLTDETSMEIRLRPEGRSEECGIER